MVVLHLMPVHREDRVRPSVRRIRAIHRRLRRQQGPFRRKPRRPAVDELILTILSQATSDVNSGRAFASLKEAFPTWDAVEAGPARRVAAAIRPGGIAEVKARRIKAILAEIRRREGRIDLRRLARLDDDQVVDYLCSLPGVGPKTAACVMAFSMGRDAFPVDTHVHRVTTRLGLVDRQMSAEAVHAELAPRVPPELRYDLHVALIAHGRTVCTARAPRCSDCVLLDLCADGPNFLADGVAR